ATYNQAIMEFGAMQCKPKNPDCNNCPFKQECFALKNNVIEKLPFKEKKTKQRNRYFNYIVNIENKQLNLVKRGENDIWQGLYDFPVIETQKPIIDIKTLVSYIKKNHQVTIKEFVLKSKSEEQKHIL